ncbi:uncharacterized protein TNCV_3298771 [Trichonephila clavipes]|uniref:DNA-directed DNA polymerase n=1 Tax=Trichonephila clavipes TaxID=2585209 RepID=A0A8X7B8H3_TRICX|nr:uncharacterized protein TNCV_3298771 [Trichonephila clavipes]
MEKCYCTKSELDLFTTSPIQLAIDRSSFVGIHPVASISDNNTIEFLISGLGESYFDLSHLFLHVQARILKGNGEAFQNDDKCGPINYLLNTMFAECHISLNDRQISSENNYAYKAYIKSMLFHSESSQILLSAGLFVKETVGKFDDVTLTDAGLNKGLRKRWDRVKNRKVFHTCGILYTDIGTQSKLLINGTSIRIRLIKAKNEFSLLAATGDYRLQIENISIYVRKCEISSLILVAHEKALEQSLIQMPFTRIEVKTFTVSSGLKSAIIPNGIPTTAYTPDSAKDLYAKNYLSLFTDLAQHKTNVSYDDYKENICLYVFDLTQNKSASEPFGNVTRSGDISIHLKFDGELPETATLIAYMEMPSLIEIDKSRNEKLKRGFVEEEYPNVSPKKSVKKGKPQNIFDLDLSPPSSGSHERKGVFPYSYFSNPEILNEACLPPKAAFFNNLSSTPVKDEDYDFALLMFRTFKCKKFADYLQLYQQLDVNLLSEVFTSFRQKCLQFYKLDPCHFTTAADLTWNAGLKYTKVELELFNDINMYLWIENSIRGGICFVGKQYALANNPFIPGFNKHEEESYIIAVDANNLYGYAMSQPLPIGHFFWLTKDEVRNLDVFTLSSTDTVGYFLEVDILYPASLHDLHDFPLAADHLTITYDMLSPYQNINRRRGYTFSHTKPKTYTKLYL